MERVSPPISPPEPKRARTYESQPNIFPNEVIFKIFCELSFQDLNAASLVCRQWYLVSQDHHLQLNMEKSLIENLKLSSHHTARPESYYPMELIVRHVSLGAIREMKFFMPKHHMGPETLMISLFFQKKTLFLNHQTMEFCEIPYHLEFLTETDEYVFYKLDLDEKNLGFQRKGSEVVNVNVIEFTGTIKMKITNLFAHTKSTFFITRESGRVDQINLKFDEPKVQSFHPPSEIRQHDLRYQSSVFVYPYIFMMKEYYLISNRDSPPNSLIFDLETKKYGEKDLFNWNIEKPTRRHLHMDEKTKGFYELRLPMIRGIWEDKGKNIRNQLIKWNLSESGTLNKIWEKAYPYPPEDCQGPCRGSNNIVFCDENYLITVNLTSDMIIRFPPRNLYQYTVIDLNHDGIYVINERLPARFAVRGHFMIFLEVPLRGQPDKIILYHIPTMTRNEILLEYGLKFLTSVFENGTYKVIACKDDDMHILTY
ncbi:MAG: hypothetical protein K940chlam3_01576, partial [Chlamydiae bacterium]|nr:hypothetical protein [Chlamydiota bacterium]